MKKHALIAIVLVIAIVAAISGYYIGVLTKPPVVSEESPLPSTTPASPIQSTTPTPSSQPAWTPPERIRAAWIYVGPVGDMGWSYMHDIGRRVVEELFGDWLKTTYKESVTEAQLLSVIDELVAQGYNVIFTTSFEFMDKTIEAAKKYPNVMFFHCSGYKRAPNVGTYFADLYQVYYLNGLLAGALTKTGKIGYVAAHLIPEVVRHINAFAIGAKEVGEQLGKDIKVYVIEIGAWYDPARARQAAEVLHRQYGVDVLAFTEDSTAVVEYAKENGLYVFSHYGPMLKFGQDVVVSGQLVRWEYIYADILLKIRSGIYTPYNLENVDYWWLLSSGAVELGADINPDGSVVMINPMYEQVLSTVHVVDKLTGERVNVYDLVMKRYYQMRSGMLPTILDTSAIGHKYTNTSYISVNWAGKIGVVKYPVAQLFEPFTGPLEGYCLLPPERSYSSWCQSPGPGGTVKIPSGLMLGHADLWNMDWFVSWVVKVGG
ncbi:MAG: BMP family ABC transporter substrate-binding protein [Desulfurococcaceae archaeon]